MARIIMVYAMISSGRGLLGETLFHNSFDSLYNHLGLRLYLYIDRVPGLQQGEVRSRQSFRNKVYRKLMLLPLKVSLLLFELSSIDKSSEVPTMCPDRICPPTSAPDLALRSILTWVPASMN